MLRILLISLLFFISVPALAIYKCESGDKVTYSDAPCSKGKSSELSDKVQNSSAADVTKTKEQSAQEKIKLKQLENERHKRETKEEKQQQQLAKAAASKQKKCGSLAEKKKWSSEDAANATGKRLETAKRKARRMAEKYESECGK